MRIDELPNPPAALLVPACDFTVAEALELPAEVICATVEDGAIVLEGNGGPRLPFKEASRVLGVLTLTAEAQANGVLLAELWHSAVGAQIPVLDFGSADASSREIAIYREIIKILSERTAAFARETTKALEMLATLRAETESARSALRQTRNFLLESVERKRWLSQAHGPLSRAEGSAFKLLSGQRLLQRMTASSKGLSDVGIFLPEQVLPKTGLLQVWLHLKESNSEVGFWDIAAPNISPGWLRLSLVSALDDDEQTVTLDLHWQGASALSIGASLFHPDPEFRAIISGQSTSQMLAHRVWKYLPGAPAPMPTNTNVRATRGVPFYIEAEHLATARSANEDAESVKFFPSLEALQVHPRKVGVSAARLIKSVPPGTREIRLKIGGRHEQGPAIEYSVAVAPHHPLKDIGDLLDDCARDKRQSDWVCLQRDEEDDVIFYLPKPLYEAADLLLATRLAEGAKPAFAWGTFRNIRMMG